MKSGKLRFGAFVLILLPTILNAQVEFQNGKTPASPLFFADFWNTQADSPEKSRVTIYLRIPRHHLQFIKTASDSFKAEIEKIVIVLDKSGFQVEGLDKKYVYKLASFEDTRLRHNFFELNETIDLDPGQYKIKISIEDMETGRIDVSELKLRARDFAASPVTVSEVLVGDSLWVDASGASHVEPLANRPRTQAGPLHGLFEIYASESFEQFEVEINVHNVLNKRVFQDRKNLKQEGRATPVVFSVGDEFLPMGNYKISVKVRAGSYQAKVERAFRMMWSGFPITASDMKTALKQLRYIATRKEINKIKKAHPDSQRQAFTDFWKKHDPDPNTEENEMMDEYYRRIQYANANFRGMTEGWRTDRGMIYVILGPPSSVERDDFNASGFRSRSTIKSIKALQIWRYYHFNRVFVFLDDTGLGDFRLENREALRDIYIRR